MRQFTIGDTRIFTGDYIEIHDSRGFSVIGRIHCISKKYVHVSKLFLIHKDNTIKNLDRDVKYRKDRLREDYDTKRISVEEYYALII